MKTDDQELLKRLKQGDNKAFELIYQYYYREFLSWFIRNYGCSSNEAKEAFQSAVVVLYENIARGIITSLRSSVKTYLYGIGKNKLREQARKFGRMSGDLSVVTDIPEEITDDIVLSPEHMSVIREALTSLGEPCRELLELYYYRQHSMEEIAHKLNYSNANSAKNQKYKCLLRLRKVYRERINEYTGI
jgi:RNA polymerase sigma factor (sigma-70 family)